MVTEEDLANMSPEQIAELQKQNCIFCHIVSGRVSSKKIYEDKDVLAILDINPANPGHILLLPKKHYMIMPQIPDDLIGHLGMVTKALSHAILRALKVEGVNVFIANGTVAGQKAPHFMIHLIPRKPKDGLNNFFLRRQKIADEVQKQLYSRLLPKVNELFGIKKDYKMERESQEDYKKEKDNDGNKNNKGNEYNSDNQNGVKGHKDQKVEISTKEVSKPVKEEELEKHEQEEDNKKNKEQNYKEKPKLDAITELLSGAKLVK